MKKKPPKRYKPTTRPTHAFMKAQEATFKLRELSRIPRTTEEAWVTLERAFNLLDAAYRLLGAELCGKQFDQR